MFQLSIVTPAGKFFEDKVESLAAPGLMGSFEVYSEHMPMLCALGKGKVRIRKDHHEAASFTIDSGVLEVTATHSVLILVDQILNEK